MIAMNIMQMSIEGAMLIIIVFLSYHSGLAKGASIKKENSNLAVGQNIYSFDNRYPKAVHNFAQRAGFI